MTALDFGASEDELTAQDCWHMESRWEQASLVVESWVVMQVPPMCVKVVLPSLGQTLIASCLRVVECSCTHICFPFQSSIRDCTVLNTVGVTL